jgi:hypothetical protein
MKTITILIILLASGPVLAGEETWIVKPDGCEKFTERFSDILEVASDTEASRQYNIELVKFETSDEGRTLVIKAPSENYIVYADSESFCKKIVADYQKYHTKHDNIDSTATDSAPTLKAHASEWFSADTNFTKCKKASRSPAEAIQAIRDNGGVEPRTKETRDDKNQLQSVEVIEYIGDGIDRSVTYYKTMELCNIALKKRNSAPDEYY